MTTLRDIKKRIVSVENTQKITRAMKLVSAAKLRRFQGSAVRARNYADEMEALVYRVSENLGVNAPALMRRHSPERLDLLIISSDKGLCGGFNEGLVKKVDEVVKMHSRHGIDTTFIVYGKKAYDAIQKLGYKIEIYNPLGKQEMQKDQVEKIAELVARRFLRGVTDGSFLAYNYFKSTVAHEVVFRDLLPFHRRRINRAYQVEYLFEPERSAVLEELAYSTLVAIIMQGFRESRTSEFASRMMAMDAATRNGDDMIEHLTMLYHRARKRSITRELMDVINGAEAIST